MNGEQLAAAFERHGVIFPPGAGEHVVQLEMIDLDGVSARLLWMEGRGFDWRGIAHGAAEPRNPGPDNPLRWPDAYLERLYQELAAERSSPQWRVVKGPTHRVEVTGELAIVLEFGASTRAADVRESFDAALSALDEQRRQSRDRPTRAMRADFRIERAVYWAWLRGTARPCRLVTFKELADHWERITSEWKAGLEASPDEWPDTLAEFPQALPAYEEWVDRGRAVEALDESTVREALAVLRPDIRKRGDTATA